MLHTPPPREPRRVAPSSTHTHPGQYEPSDEWKAEVRARIRNEARQMQHHAIQNLRDHWLKRSKGDPDPYNNPDFEKECKNIERQVQTWANDSYRSELEKEINLSRFMAGEQVEGDWQHFLEEQEAILKQIEEEKGISARVGEREDEEHSPISPDLGLSAVSPPDHTSETPFSTLERRGSARRPSSYTSDDSYSPTIQAGSHRQRSSQSRRAIPEFWTPPPESEDATILPKAPFRRGSNASTRSVGSQRAPITTATIPERGPVPNDTYERERTSSNNAYHPPMQSAGGSNSAASNPALIQLDHQPGIGAHVERNRAGSVNSNRSLNNNPSNPYPSGERERPNSFVERERGVLYSPTPPSTNTGDGGYSGGMSDGERAYFVRSPSNSINNPNRGPQPPLSVHDMDYERPSSVQSGTGPGGGAGGGGYRLPPDRSPGPTFPTFGPPPPPYQHHISPHREKPMMHDRNLESVPPEWRERRWSQANNHGPYPRPESTVYPRSESTVYARSESVVYPPRSESTVYDYAPPPPPPPPQPMPHGDYYRRPTIDTRYIPQQTEYEPQPAYHPNTYYDEQPAYSPEEEYSIPTRTESRMKFDATGWVNKNGTDHLPPELVREFKAAASSYNMDNYDSLPKQEQLLWLRIEQVAHNLSKQKEDLEQKKEEADRLRKEVEREREEAKKREEALKQQEDQLKLREYQLLFREKEVEFNAKLREKEDELKFREAELNRRMQQVSIDRERENEQRRIEKQREEEERARERQREEELKRIAKEREEERRRAEDERRREMEESRQAKAALLQELRAQRERERQEEERRRNDVERREEQRRLAEEEEKRKSRQAEEEARAEARRIAKEEEEEKERLRKKAEEEERERKRRQAEEEEEKRRQRQAEEEERERQKRAAEEEEKERQRVAAEEERQRQKRAEKERMEAKRREIRRRMAEDEAKARKLAEEEERRRKEAEEEERIRREQAEEEAKWREVERRRKEQEKKRLEEEKLRAEEEERQKRREEAERRRKLAEEEERRKQRLAEEEQERKAEEEQRRRSRLQAAEAAAAIGREENARKAAIAKAQKANEAEAERMLKEDEERAREIERQMREEQERTKIETERQRREEQQRRDEAKLEAELNRIHERAAARMNQEAQSNGDAPRKSEESSNTYDPHERYRSGLYGASSTPPRKPYSSTSSSQPYTAERSSSTSSTWTGWESWGKTQTASSSASSFAGQRANSQRSPSAPTNFAKSGAGASGATNSQPASTRTPLSSAEWARRQAEHAKKQQEQFILEQERLERARQEKLSKSMSREDVMQTFEWHERMWVRLAEAETLTWDSFPWPMLKKPTSPEEITTPGISAYILNPLGPGKEKPSKDRIKEQIRRWHPDRFETKLLPKVDSTQTDQVKAGAGAVVRCLNELLARTNSSASGNSLFG